MKKPKIKSKKENTFKKRVKYNGKTTEPKGSKASCLGNYMTQDALKALAKRN